jgi:malic enzyme
VEEAMRTTPRVEALLAQARKPAEEALRLHPVYRGKLEVTLKCPIEEKGLSEEYILPRLDDRDAFPQEAAAVGIKAIEPGVARRTMTQEALLERASTLIKRARVTTRTLMEHGISSLAG